MKTKLTSLILIAAFLGLGACATVEKYVTPSMVRTAAAVVCGNVLTWAVSDADRAAAADYLYGIAFAVRTTSGGKLLTTEEFEAVIKTFTPKTSKWLYLHRSIAGLYGGFYALVKGMTGRALEYIEALAAGIEDAAANLKTPSPTPNS